MSTLTITGYQTEVNCEHCGRYLKHGISLSCGRVVGAQCLNAKMTKPRVKSCGKKYRYGAEYIIKAAKCAEFLSAEKWAAYGVSEQSMTFEAC